MKRAAFLLAALSILCLSSGLASWAQDSGVIKVGVVLPLTGEQAKFGEIEKNSFLMALEAINNAGGINGKKIELLIEDDTGKPDVGRSAAEKLITSNNVVALSGGYSSSVSFVVAAAAQQRKVPFLVTTGSADKITEQKWNYVFRVGPPVSDYPQAVMTFLSEIVKPKSVALLYENTLFGQSGAKEFSELCEKAGIKVIVKEGYESGAIDFKPVLTKSKAAKPDFVYMISYVMDAGLLMRQAREINFNPRLFIGGGAGFTMPEFPKNAGEASENVFSVDLWGPTLPYPGAKEYYDAYKKKYDVSTEYHGAEAYASMQVIADALKRAKTLDTAGVRDALAATDTKTVFGPVKFVAYDKKTQQNKLPSFLIQWQKGESVLVWPKEFATAPFIFPVPPWSNN